MRNTKMLKTAVKTYFFPSNTPANSSPDAFGLFHTQNDLSNSSNHDKHLDISL